jgi:hypothetical protein
VAHWLFCSTQKVTGGGDKKNKHQKITQTRAVNGLPGLPMLNAKKTLSHATKFGKTYGK